MLDKVALKRSTFLMENLIKNGDLSQGSDYWNLDSQWSIIDGKLVFLSPGGPSGYNATPTQINLTVGNKYYFSAIFGKYEESDDVYRWSINGLLTFVNENIYGKRDFILTATSSPFFLRFSGAGGNVTIDNLLLIDLTKTFGAGNEPTAKQMDELLSQFPDSWFDGTKNVFNAEHMLKMYFNKMMELDNAITSLGGSI